MNTIKKISEKVLLLLLFFSFIFYPHCGNRIERESVPRRNFTIDSWGKINLT